MEKTDDKTVIIVNEWVKNKKLDISIHDIVISNVYENRYRVDVYIQKSKGFMTILEIANSYFIKIDGEPLKITNLTLNQ